MMSENDDIKPPQTAEEALTHIKECVKEGQIEFAPSDMINGCDENKLDYVVQSIAKALGRKPFKRYMLTDYSVVSDFDYLHDTKPLDYDKLSTEIGFDVHPTACIWEIVKKLSEH